MNNQCTAAGLDRLYAAVQHQAEHDFMEAIKREYPEMSAMDEADMLNKYQHLRLKAEQRIIAKALAQSRGK